MEKENKDDLWIKICVLPLIVGFSLVIAKISMKIFKLIGWFLFIFGLSTGAYYIYVNYYKPNKEKINDVKDKILKMFRRKNRE